MSDDDRTIYDLRGGRHMPLPDAQQRYYERHNVRRTMLSSDMAELRRLRQQAEQEALDELLDPDPPGRLARRLEEKYGGG